MSHLVDFNLHNLFTIRLETPSPKAIQAVINQVGVRPSNVDAEPDLIVRYTDHFEAPMYHLEMGKAGFFKDNFYVMAGNGRNDLRVQIPFEALGQPCTIMCETGTTEIPLLDLMINLAMLRKGLAPVHASGFVTDGMGVVVNGWPKGGKTTTLFSFLKHGARFVSDDWLFLDSDDKMHGLMQPIKLSGWQLDQLPEYKASVTRTRQWTMRGARWLDERVQAVPHSTRNKFPPAKAFYKGLRKLNESQSSVYLPVERLIGPELNPPSSHFHVLLLTLSQDREEIDVAPLAYELALERLMAALQNEWLHWEKYYTQYIYAFPNRRNALMDTVYEEQRRLLAHLLKDKHIFAVYHPHPVNLDDLYRKISQVIKQVKGFTSNAGAQKIRTV